MIKLRRDTRIEIIEIDARTQKSIDIDGLILQIEHIRHDGSTNKDYFFIEKMKPRKEVEELQPLDE